jgi:diguanylate cyclase (GGDEF)-like protein
MQLTLPTRSALQLPVFWFGMGAFGRLLIAVVCWLALPVWATQTLDLLAPPQYEVGEQATMLTESAAAMTPQQALVGLQRDGVLGRAKVLNLGIGRPAQWLLLDLHNPSDQTLTRHILLGQSWLDHIDVWVLTKDSVVRHWQTGDEVAGQPGLNEVHGYVFTHTFAPGTHRLLVRVQTDDQLTINLRLRTPEQADREASRDHYLYGFLYGFIASLVAYNLMLFVGLRQRVYLLYALYLSSFLLLNLAYTGRGALWLWGDWVAVQRFSNVSLIILMPSAGLLFARDFLQLRAREPRLDRWLSAFTWGGPALLIATIVTGAYEASTWLAFVVLGLFIFIMVGLGVQAVRSGQPAARFFLMGAICSMVGTALTEFSVWGFIPFSVWAYRGIELGMMLDATLLALALAEFVRTEVTQRRVAELAARIDPLTQLENRRGLNEAAIALMAAAERGHEPLSLAVMDIDHFKQVNDRYGHKVGDLVISEVAACVRHVTRINDHCARWGGEEFAILMPAADRQAAEEMAERVRRNIQDACVKGDFGIVRVTASFGVVQWRNGESITDLLARADVALYQAKNSGRNRVELG